jgi:pimeloyl-ACP methyl ester carboxylesterase
MSCSPAVEERAPAEEQAQTETVSELRDSFFDSDGVRIHFVEQGQGDPVVMLHGFSGSYQDFINFGLFKSLVDEGYRAIAVDHRGYGQSDKPHDTAAYGIEMAEDVVRLLDHLNIEKAHVMGLSMGGFITNKLRSIHPDRLLTVVLGSTSWIRENDERLVFAKKLADGLDQGQGPEMMAQLLTPEGEGDATAEAIDQAYRERLADQDLDALAAVLRGHEGFVVSEEDLRQNQVPTLAIIGAKDPLKEGVDAMEGVMNNLEIVVIEGEGHGAARNPAYIDGIKKFLEKHGQPATETT